MKGFRTMSSRKAKLLMTIIKTARQKGISLTHFTKGIAKVKSLQDCSHKQLTGFQSELLRM